MGRSMQGNTDSEVAVLYTDEDNSDYAKSLRKQLLSQFTGVSKSKISDNVAVWWRKAVCTAQSNADIYDQMYDGGIVPSNSHNSFDAMDREKNTKAGINKNPALGSKLKGVLIQYPTHFLKSEWFYNTCLEGNKKNQLVTMISPEAARTSCNYARYGLPRPCVGVKVNSIADAQAKIACDRMKEVYTDRAEQRSECTKLKVQQCWDTLECQQKIGGMYLTEKEKLRVDMCGNELTDYLDHFTSSSKLKTMAKTFPKLDQKYSNDLRQKAPSAMELVKTLQGCTDCTVIR